MADTGSIQVTKELIYAVPRAMSFPGEVVFPAATIPGFQTTVPLLTITDYIPVLINSRDLSCHSFDSAAGYGAAPDFVYSFLFKKTAHTRRNADYETTITQSSWH